MYITKVYMDMKRAPDMVERLGRKLPRQTKTRIVIFFEKERPKTTEH